MRALVSAAVLGALLAPAPAAAQDRGEAQLQVGGRAAKQLKRAGVTIRAARPALGRTRVTLPVASAEVGSNAVVQLRGALRLRKGKRTVRLEKLRLSVRARSVTLSAAVGGRRVSALSGRYPAKRLAMEPATGRVLLTATKLTLSRPAAKRIAARLRLARVPKGELGRLALGIPPGGSSQPGGGTTPGGGGPGTPGGGGTPTPQELPKLTRPATAVSITGASVNWHVRDSLIEYMNSGEGTSASAGATAGPAKVRCGGGASYDYDFGFPFAEGWYDPPSGTAAIYFSGAVRFQYSDHGIDILTSNPEIEINGASSRAIFRVKDSDGDRRGVLTDFKQPGGVAPAETCHGDPGPSGSANPQVAGTTYTYERMPGTVPESAAAGVFAGFYPANAPFGWFTVTFTTP